MLHLASILLAEKEQITKFKKYFEWFYNNLKVSRYTEVYVCRLLLGNKGYKEPKKYMGKTWMKQLRDAKIRQIRQVMPHIKDSDVEEIAEQVLGKLRSMTDEEFAEVSLEAAEEM